MQQGSVDLTVTSPPYLNAIDYLRGHKMSLVWMGVVAGLIFVQKVAPHGDRLSRPFAVAFVAVGIWIASASSTVPGLTQPNSPAADQARMRMMHVQPGMQSPQMKSPSTGDSSMMP